MRKLSFPLALNDEELGQKVGEFDEKAYLRELEKLFLETGIVEDGSASARAAAVNSSF